MKRIGWIRTHHQSNRKTIIIRPFGQVLRTPLIKTFLLFPNISKNIFFNSGAPLRFEPTTIGTPKERLGPLGHEHHIYDYLFMAYKFHNFIETFKIELERRESVEFEPATSQTEKRYL